MKKQIRVEFAPQLKVDDFPAGFNLQQTETIEQPDEETANSDNENAQNDETLDMAILQELIKDEEKTLDLLIKDNDRAVEYILIGEMNNALGILDKMEKLMEYLAANGRILDRNIIIVCLYNIAATYQASWQLAKCAKYIEAVTYNLAQSISHDELAISSLRMKTGEESQVLGLKAIMLRKKQFLVKVYLQYCAVSSQLNKHEEALQVAQRAQEIMASTINECFQVCKEISKNPEFENKSNPTPQKGIDRSKSATMSGSSSEIRKGLLSDITFKDEVYYNRQIVETALPFLEDFMKNTKEFSRGQMSEIVSQTRNLFLNWKNNPENNEKYIRKELNKNKIPNNLQDENRTLLGVQQEPEWLETLNIGSIMHMRPLKYKDYAQRREFINELTKTSLQEKSIFQSLVFFTLATEMRFMEGNVVSDVGEDSKDTKDSPKKPGTLRISEAYHLKSIEVACRYITGPCPYINHLITSYQKHYGQDLETIPEESVNSFNESTISRDIAEKLHMAQTKKEEPQENLVARLQTITNKCAKRFNTTRERTKEPQMSDEEKYKEMRRDRKAESFKSLNIRAKKVLNKQEESKKFYSSGTSNQSLCSPTRHSKTELSVTSPKLYNKASGSRFETEAVERSDDRYNVKKDTNVPSIGFHSMYIKEKTPQSYSKVIRNDGFQSERGLTSKEVGFLRNFDSFDGDRKQKGILPNDNNLYLYKNFNKFIQNFYVKNEQAMHKKALEDKIKEKYLKHPYQKDKSSDPKARKSLLLKKSSSTIMNYPLTQAPLAKLNQTGKKDNQSPLEKYQSAELLTKTEIKRPKTATKRTGMTDDEITSHLRGNSTSLKLHDKLVKSLSSKDFEFLRGNSASKK